MGRIFPYLANFCAAIVRLRAQPGGLNRRRFPLARPRARFGSPLARPRARFDSPLARPRARFDSPLARPRARFDLSAVMPFSRSLALVCVVAVAMTLPWVALGQDAGVFRYRDRQGREVYTNLEGHASHGGTLQAVDLPPLSSIDFGSRSPEELRRLDAQVRESHGALQTGERCEAIRKSSRVPLRTRIWSDHGLKIYVSAALLAFAVLLGYLGSNRRLGLLFPLAPFLGFVFLIYATVRDTRATFQTLTAGLRACSEQLPDGDPESGEAVKGRLSKALDVRRSVNAAYARQAEQIEAIMRER